MKNIHYILRKATRLPDDLQNLEADTVQWAEIPLLGAVSAGKPIDIHTEAETVAVPASFVRKECYALRVKGDSMIDEHIHDGDIIIVKSQTHAHNGQSVVALINGDQTTLKKFYVEADGIRLQPANPDMAPIRLGHDQVEILGIVECILRLPNGH